LALQCEDVRVQIKRVSAGTTINYLSLGNLAKIRVLNPPLTLQNEFADFVKQVDKSKFEVQHGLDKLELLYKSLMQQYFG
jgi:type I restriction enzyme S subunit